MEPNTIELKLISGKDLKAFNFFQKLNIYALVFISSNDPKRKLTEEQKQRKRTQTDRHKDSDDDDGSNPEWNHETRFDMGCLSKDPDSTTTDLFFQFEFRHHGVILGDKIIGECRVPLDDLIRDVEGVTRFVSYEVRSSDGRPNGIFNFSYKVKGIGTHTTSNVLDGRISGYPVLAPEDCVTNQSHVPYPTCGIDNTCETENTCCYPKVECVQEGLLYPLVVPAAPPPPPPPVSFMSTGECHCYYPPPPPPQPPYPYPPPPPPVKQQYYPSFGPGAHPWPSGPYFEHRW